MPHCRRVLVLLLLLTVTIDLGTHALKCRLYHRIWEDGHLLRINPDICHTSSKYCVRATYADPDDRKKNGYSMGCDKVDCQGIDNPNFTGWHQKENGEYCRKNRDYGKKGEICCCTSDMCNSSSRLVLSGMIMFFVFLTVNSLWIVQISCLTTHFLIFPCYGAFFLPSSYKFSFPHKILLKF